jgi:exonuclease SbcD
MRGLHTSDWHLGVFKHKLDRTRDHDHVLAQIRAIAVDEKVDVIIHTGDLFDTAYPSIETLKYGWLALEELAMIAPIIIVCGNHDGPKLFELMGTINARRLPIYFIDPASLRKGADSVVKVPTAADEVVRIAAVPFIKSASYIRDYMTGNTARATVTYADEVGALERLVGTWLNDGFNVKTDIRIFAAHLLVDGAQVSGSEYRFHVDSDFATFSNRIPSADYVAFGHIHKPQSIIGIDHGRYAGSPIQVDFGEVSDQKCVYLISGSPGRPLQIEERTLDVGRRLVDITGTLPEITAAATTYAGQIARVRVILDAPLTDLDGRVRDILTETIVCEVVGRYEHAQAEVVAARGDEGEREPTLDEMFSTYVDAHQQIGDPARVKSYFGKLLDKVERNDDDNTLSDVDELLA